MASEKTKLAPIWNYVCYQSWIVVIGKNPWVFFSGRKQIKPLAFLGRLVNPYFRSLTSEQPSLPSPGMWLRGYAVTPFIILDNMLPRRYHILENAIYYSMKHCHIPLQHHIKNLSETREVPIWAICHQTSALTLRRCSLSWWGAPMAGAWQQMAR